MRCTAGGRIVTGGRRFAFIYCSRVSVQLTIVAAYRLFAGCALSEGAVLRVDLPGNGRSTGSVRMNRVAWLDAVLAEVTEPVLLVGHALGTEFALRYAAIGRLILSLVNF